MAIIYGCPKCKKNDSDYRSWHNWPKEPKEASYLCNYCGHTGYGVSIQKAKQNWRLIKNNHIKKTEKMKNEDKVCTADQAKQLSDLGFKIVTDQYWKSNGDYYELRPHNYESNYETFPAPDVAELGESLQGWQIILVTGEDANVWALYRPDNILDSYLPGKYDAAPEAQARCAALIWLIENNHIKIK